MADDPDLVGDGRENDKDWVRYLQEILEFWNFWSGEKDGEFTEDLDDAVRSFQGAQLLHVDGWVGPHTWKVLRREGVVFDFARFPLLKQLGQAGGNEAALKRYYAALFDVSNLDDFNQHVGSGEALP